ncbi:MAG: Rap1a/Tai family immunity protein [Massilia sp.]
MRALILAGLVLATPAHAASPWMTGAQLLQKLLSPTGATEAVSYLKGVHDMTADRTWCYSAAKPGTAQLQSALVDGLRALSPAQAQRNAGELAAQIWRAKWPCQPNGCCHD